MKNTLIINLFGGPGCGKSTGASYIFSKLKMAGIDAEYIPEFAKDKVWENNQQAFDNEFYLVGKQSWRIGRVFGKVDIIVTDSPIILGALYCKDDEPMLVEAIKERFNKYARNNINIRLNRVKPYNPNGRNQTEREAKGIDIKTKELLDKCKIKYYDFDGNLNGYDEIVNFVINCWLDFKDGESVIS